MEIANELISRDAQFHDKLDNNNKSKSDGS